MSNKTLELIYGTSTYEKITHSNVLIVGSGGIGCELVKNLAKSGYNKFTIIDLDTIEVSNLNRQFYFRPIHAQQKRAKAEIAKESVLQYNPNLEIEAYKASIFESRFDIDFFRTFDIVFCALDNKEAREHLGTMCTMSKRVMVDAGTQGYAGQVKTQIREIYECNHCKPIPPPEKFALCTLRNDPSQPIHCIAWAKYLYEVVFGPQDEENIFANYIKLPELTNQEDFIQGAIQLFNKIFYEDIFALKKSDDGKSYIRPLTYEEALTIKNPPLLRYEVQTTIETPKISTQRLWTIAECAEEFVKNFALSLKMHYQDIGFVKFDKDDEYALKFVCAATNLRTYNYLAPSPGINKLEYLSIYDLKEKAGNIIAAIGSTNAIVAGIQIIEATKAIMGAYKDLRAVWLANQPPYKLTNTFQTAPKLHCENCSDKHLYINMKLNFDKCTLNDIKLIAKELYRASAMRISYFGSEIYRENETDEYYAVEYAKNLEKTMNQVKEDLGEETLNSLVVQSDTESFIWNFYFKNADIQEKIIIDDFCNPDILFEQQKRYIQKLYDREVQNKNKYYSRYIF